MLLCKSFCSSILYPGYFDACLAIVILAFCSRGQMISADDCDFIQKFEKKRSPEEKQELLQTEGHQVL